jgi:hypothetical protein
VPALIASPLLRLALMALALVAAAIAGYVHGVKYEQGRQAVEHNKQLVEAHEKMVARIEKDKKSSAEVQKKLDAESAARSRDTETFYEKLQRARNDAKRGVALIECPVARAPATADGNLVLKRADDLRADSAGRLTDAARRLWNEGLSAGTTIAERAGWLAEADKSTGPVEIDAALRNLRINAALLGECRTREALTIQWLCDEKLASCR